MRRAPAHRPVACRAPAPVPCRALSSSSSSSDLGPLKIALDLDECMVHSKFMDSSVEMRQAEARPEMSFDDADDVFGLKLDDGEEVHVGKRPGLDEFLRAVRDIAGGTANVVVFTAAMESYASPVLTILEESAGGSEGSVFGKRFYRDSCSIDDGAYAKDLRVVADDPDDLRRTVLVDNNPLSFLAQPENGLLVPSWYGGGQTAERGAGAGKLPGGSLSPSVRGVAGGAVPPPPPPLLPLLHRPNPNPPPSPPPRHAACRGGTVGTPGTRRGYPPSPVPRLRGPRHAVRLQETQGRAAAAVVIVYQ